MTAFLIASLTGCASGDTENAASDSSPMSQTTDDQSLADSAIISDNSYADTTVSPNNSYVDTAVSPDDSHTEKEASVKEICPENVVAVSKSIADLWLLSGGSLSGTTEDAMELEGITENTAVIGTLSRPNIEAILALSPDLVLLTEDIPSQKELKTELEDMDILALAIDINSFEDYMACMDELTDMTGRKDLYEQNAVEVSERIKKILETAKASGGSLDTEKKTFLAMRVSATKNKALKDDYFACEIFRDFGLVNIAEENNSLDELNLEAIAAADPDYIFVIPQGGESEAMESYRTQFEENPVWRELGAVKENRLFIMPKEYFQYKPNAQWDTAYEYVYQLLREA
ncbi:MAG: ABC transporter substrate-binding protein [Lachnospiraceae bacterium]|nr:ABC transporter substrate-binding protein [Lachnospiraceae bacterium]